MKKVSKRRTKEVKKNKKAFFSAKRFKQGSYLKKKKDYSKLGKIIGVYSSSKNGNFGFVDVEGQEKGYFVYPKNLNGALDGDEVEAIIKTFKGRKEAVITRILRRAEKILVGKVKLKKNFALVTLDNQTFKSDIYIPSKELLRFRGLLRNGVKVATKIVSWGGKNPKGIIFEVFGDESELESHIKGAILEAGVRVRFGEDVLAEAENLEFKDQESRVDLTKEFIFTIDGDDAKDLDDAISVKRDGKNYRLIVSIADVSEYVKEGSFLDKEALKRGNSIYLVDRVIPMLPEKLSNDLCSLNPNTKKLTLTCEMIIDKNGNVISKKVYESVVSSKFRLTYREVQEISDGKLKVGDGLKFGGTVTPQLFESIKLCYELKDVIVEKKSKLGMLDFNLPETKIELDDFGNPISIKEYERYESMKIIEEFMILANQSVGELFSSLPFVYRIHPVQSKSNLEKLRNVLNIFGLKLQSKRLTPKSLAQVLDEIKGNPKEKVIQKLILRSLEKAFYSDKNEGHFGLNLKYYSHFTSPIRRYPDLQIHRIIKEKLSGKLDGSRIKHYKGILKTVSKISSDSERKAEKLEYLVRDLMICKYYENRIGEEFEGIISGLTENGFFVELENTAEGFVCIKQVCRVIGKSRYSYNPELMRFEFKKDLTFQVGDSLRVKISSVEIDKKRLNFDFLEKIVK